MHTHVHTFVYIHLYLYIYTQYYIHNDLRLIWLRTTALVQVFLYVLREFKMGLKLSTSYLTLIYNTAQLE